MDFDRPAALGMTLNVWVRVVAGDARLWIWQQGYFEDASLLAASSAQSQMIRDRLMPRASRLPGTCAVTRLLMRHWQSAGGRFGEEECHRCDRSLVVASTGDDAPA